jgi:hypothetical protein
MMVTVDFVGAVAVISEMVWSCEDAQFQDLLNSMLDPLGPSGADPDPDHTAAMDAIKRLGSGKVTRRDEVEYVEGRIY